ncbi:ethanolamine ammonia-lyase subunit EutC [Pimelobacter simplex]|uniref:Ethanolamine ammonia-lyase small subunit n=2 Tax=Nocardioides simplex TaxID=2045 RepID=A0A0A1DQV8_NOCSI|nr:ethanolamine ammonia-lyase subunit EutC [Pimelobacter simplex]AIY18967.1 Ethanolamine ammonia-lyase light chain [Pimelobacter simplex]GEB14730.1 ethanolamine ammonia-lyase light chain [Pimelobacter simplex]SFM26197.1 Ethanolamine ammonia-lyase light chain [Pimelobacter simplex]
MSDFWQALRAHTPARIGQERHGEAPGTRDRLAFATAHAAARDAVHQPLDVPALVAELATVDGLAPACVVASAAPDRATYLTRPDLGRRPRDPVPALTPGAEGDPDLLVVLADGLSALAVERHAAGVLRALLPLLPASTRLAPPVVATQARVALADHVGLAWRARLALVLIGERPGLTTADSLGAYLTWAPRPGVADAARNCVSNIHPPHGLDHATAARTIASLVQGATLLGATGVALKEGRAALG